MRKRACLLLPLCLCLLLGGCAALDIEGETVASAPNLGLLSMPAYEESAPTPLPDDGAGTLRVDLWLSGSQVLGGINTGTDGLYPHMSRRYREGGFHYRFGERAGWYDDLLRDLLATSEGSLTRVLRFGNERLPDAFIAQAGLADADDAEAIRSLRRDLLTYAISPLPSIFDEFSAEDMENSYYTLGTPLLDQTARFAPDGGAALENPGHVELMSALLQRQIALIASGEAGELAAATNDTDYPLLYAINNLDLSRLSVVCFDPAELRRLSGTDVHGETVRYVQGALDARGVFDAGLSVGLYAFELDYMGQMSSFSSVDLAEPLVWGKLKYDNKKNKPVDVLPMPRTLLALVVGDPAQAEPFTDALNARLDADAALKGLRGPEDGELSYTRDGQTVTQQPFSFAYHFMSIERPTVECLTQHTSGMTLTATGGEITRDGSLLTAPVSLDEASPTLTLTFPLASPDGDVSLDLTRLESANVTVLNALTLKQTLPNDPDAEPPKDAGTQTIAVRDKLYVYQSVAMPYQSGQSPFTLASLAPSEDGKTLVAVVRADTSLLAPGYYRLSLSAELSGRQFTWKTEDWIDGADTLDVSVTNDQIVEWESFAELIHKHDGKRTSVPRQFQHAWGGFNDNSYHGVKYPDLPPVYRVYGLRELTSQLRAAANIDVLPFVRCVFDVLVDEGGK